MKTSKELSIADLNQQVSNLAAEVETFDPRVSLDYDLSRQPSRVDPDGTEWFSVRLSLSPRRGFDLSQVNLVVYFLPPHFGQPGIATSDPLANFALQIENWESFYIRAVVFFRESPEQLTLLQYVPVGERLPLK